MKELQDKVQQLRKVQQSYRHVLELSNTVGVIFAVLGIVQSSMEEIIIIVVTKYKYIHVYLCSCVARISLL